MILGLDLATRTGWAVIDDSGERIDSGVWQLKRPKDAPSVRTMSLRDNLSVTIRLLRPDFLAYEIPRAHAGSKAAHVFGALEGVVLELDSDWLSVDTVEVSTVKRIATGRGNASKAMMVRAANRRWGIEVVDDNEADALWIAETFRQSLGVIADLDVDLDFHEGSY